MICWQLWKWRCSSVMYVDFVEHEDILLVGNRVVLEFCRAATARVGARPRDSSGNELIHRKWCRPRWVWVKANADGVCSIGTRKMAVEWVNRDESDRWLFGFAMNLGFCLSLLTEVWEVHNVLFHAWRLGFHRIELETVSLKVERILQTCSAASLGNAVVGDIH
ncbi:hypothetical protein V6N12_035221 [Hibiscus sabdariffa]|uniref:RNase H type-1 domain-containing protein n=1 Tax=Hibiscus sabdariffa TaxID=183260 RepID=A0ABR2AWL1_9ROSI